MNVNEIESQLRHNYDEIRFNSIQSYKRGWFARARTQPNNELNILFSRKKDFIFLENIFKNDYDQYFFHYTASHLHYGVYLSMRNKHIYTDIQIYVDLNEYKMSILADDGYLGFQNKQALVKSEVKLFIEAFGQWILSQKQHRLPFLLRGLSLNESVTSFLKNEKFI
jgi:hypothetical protein